MVKQQHSVRPSAHFKAATMDKDKYDGTMTIRVNENDSRYVVYIMPKEKKKNRALQGFFFLVVVEYAKCDDSGHYWWKKRNKDEGMIEPR